MVINLCGLISPPTINSERYIIFFLDSVTRYLEFKLLKFKLEVYKAFIEFKNRAENLLKNIYIISEIRSGKIIRK